MSHGYFCGSLHGSSPPRASSSGSSWGGSPRASPREVSARSDRTDFCRAHVSVHPWRSSGQCTPEYLRATKDRGRCCTFRRHRPCKCSHHHPEKNFSPESGYHIKNHFYQDKSLYSCAYPCRIRMPGERIRQIPPPTSQNRSSSSGHAPAGRSRPRGVSAEDARDFF